MGKFTDYANVMMDNYRLIRSLIDRANKEDHSITVQEIDEALKKCLSSEEYVIYAYDVANIGASQDVILETIYKIRMGQERTRQQYADELAKLIRVETLFADIEPANIGKRSNWLRILSEVYPDKPQTIMTKALEIIPQEVIIQLIRDTALFSYNHLTCSGSILNHELNNFLYTFAEAGVYRYPAIVKTLWNKVVLEIPEADMGELKFMVPYIESHPKYAEFVHFLAFDLFGEPRPGRIDPADVLEKLCSINGLWPNSLFEIVKFKGYKEKCNSYRDVQENYMQKQEYCSREESERVIRKINELFFDL